MPNLIRYGQMTYLESAANASGASTGISVTSGGSSEAYGSWTQLIASTEGDTDHVLLQIFYPRSGTVIRDFRIDLGIGAAASEQAIVTGLQFQAKEDTNQVIYYSLPIHIPKASRLSVRIAASTATISCVVAVGLFASGRIQQPGFSRIMTYGTESNSQGVAIEPGGVAHTKGSYAELITSAAYDMPAFYLNISSNNNSAHSDCTWLLDIAIGSAGSEQPIYSNLLISSNVFECTRYPVFFPIPIPKAARVAVRAQCSITDATDRILTVSISGCLA